MTENKFLSTKEAAQILDLSVRRVVGLCNQETFTGAIKEGRNWKIPKEAVLAYSGKNTVATNDGIRSCAVGNTSYVDVVKHSYYVDKTLLIRDLIDDNVPVILFTRPRRFGKTLAIDMLKSYFEKSDEDTSAYFKDKKSGLVVRNIRSCKAHFLSSQLHLKMLNSQNGQVLSRRLKISFVMNI